MIPTLKNSGSVLVVRWPRSREGKWISVKKSIDTF